MNESILKALMHLFAIVANVNKEGHFENDREIVKDYLDLQYTHEVVHKYIEYFDRQVRLFHPEQFYESSEQKARSNISNGSFIVELCTQINEELEQEQKIIVLIYLLDFVSRGNSLDDSELKFINSVAQHLKIREDEYEDIKSFTFGELDQCQHPERILIIDSKESSDRPEIKHMVNKKIDGLIVVLHLPSTNTYVCRYYGRLSLFLNGHYIKPDRSYIWSMGATIKSSKIGSLYFSRVAGQFIQASIENKFVFTAEDIEYSYYNSTNGVKRFNFSEDSSRLIGIIGGSGSGKSTLLNLLNGNLKPKNGSIKINGYDIHQDKDKIKGIIGYVPQDDLLIKEFTVYQNLYFSARFCFNDFSEEEIQKVVEKALVEFDLVEARDLYVGDAITTILSGGQRKRLNIALELIREPSILFVDEPTSGLSSADSEKVINLLKRQALKGKLVIANIHQPSSDVFKMLDKLLVMDQGGRIIYYGNPLSAVTYFKNAAKYPDADESECMNCGNINTDQILRIVEARVVDSNGRLTRKRKTFPEEWYQMYLSNIDVNVKKIKRQHDSSLPKSNFSIPGHFKQFKIFLQRDVLSKLHNRQYLVINTLEAPLLAVILAFFSKCFILVNDSPKYIFSENPNIPAFLFMSVIVALFLGLVISSEEIFKDRKILKREEFLDLSRSSYLFSKIVVLFIISAIQMLIFVLIGNYMLEIKGMTLSYWLVLFTASCSANLMGLIISSGLSSAAAIYILVPVLMVPQLLLSGVVIEYDKMHNKITSQEYVPFVGDAIIGRWAYEALMVTQFKDNRFERNFYNMDRNIEKAIFYKSYGIPVLKDLNEQCKDMLVKVDSAKLQKNLTVMGNEVIKLADDLQWQLPAFAANIKKGHYNRETYNTINNFLSVALQEYIVKYNQAADQRDKKYDALITKLGSENNFMRFNQQYVNKRVAEVVSNEKELNEYAIHDGEIIPMKDPVYRVSNSKTGRAQFYAPFKRIFNLRIDTFWFNLVFIWLDTFFLFIVLYFDIFRKFVTYLENIKLSRVSRQKLLRLLLVEQLENRKPSKGKE